MPNLKISILNVGHGDFIYIRTPLDDHIVIDCGDGNVTPSDFLSEISIITELQITHPHTDHFDDIVQFSRKNIRSFRCQNLQSFSDTTIGWKTSDKTKIDKLREVQRRIPINNSAVRSINGFQYSVWAPTGFNSSDPNTASLVTILTYNNFKMLFGGDLPNSGWEELLRDNRFVNELRGVNVFKVPHHGREDGCSDSLFRHISPMLCIISDKPLDNNNSNTSSTNWYTQRSSGANIVGHTDQRKVLTTRNDGSIFIEVEADSTWKVYRNTSWKA